MTYWPQWNDSSWHRCVKCEASHNANEDDWTETADNEWVCSRCALPRALEAIGEFCAAYEGIEATPLKNTLALGAMLRGIGA